MSSGPAIIVNKGGFLAAVAKGLFGTIMVVVICGTALGLYGLHMADRHLTSIQQLVGSPPEWREWQKALPPILGDALNDHRAPDYRASLAITTHAFVGDAGQGTVEVVIKNNGDQTVSYLPLRVVVEDESPERVCELSMMAASPLCLHNQVGTLLPGAERRISRSIWRVVGEPTVTVEIADLRLWNGPAQATPEAEPRATASALPPLPPPSNTN